MTSDHGRTRRGVLGALVAAGLAGCPLRRGPSGPSPPSATRQTGMHPSSTRRATPNDGPESADVHVLTDQVSRAEVRQWEEEIVPGFERQYDAAVAVEHEATSANRAQRLDALVADEDPPEVYYATAREVAEYVLRGQTISADELVSDLAAANGSLVADRNLRSGGITHLVPHGLVLGGVLNYRADVYEELGLSVPETWDELLANARAIDESEGVDTSGFAVVPRDSYFLPWLYTAGGDLWRWRDDAQVELDFREGHVRAALEMMQELAQYGPNPAETDYANIARLWVEGRLGQCLWPNARLAEFAYENVAGQPESADIHLETLQAPAPLRDQALDPPTRGTAITHGTPLFEGANLQHAERFLRFMYEGPARQADKTNQTMAFLPPYESVVYTDEYASTEIYRAEDGHFLELERHLVDEVVPHYVGDRPRTPAAWYAMEPGWTNESSLDGMIRGVLVDDEPIDDVIVETGRELRSRLAAGQDLRAD